MTSFSVAICLKQTKILCRQLNCLVKLTDVSTRCSSHPIALRMTRASSRNVGKFYRTVKLFAKNLCLFQQHYVLISVFSIGSNLLLPSLCDGWSWTGQKVLSREVKVLESAGCSSPWRHAVVHHIPENHAIPAKLVYQLGLANHWGTTRAILLGNILR